MKMNAIPFAAIDWRAAASEKHEGETGVAEWKTGTAGGIRVRMVEYSKGYASDHWCSKGHVILVLEGELVMELGDGTVARLGSGMSCVVGDDEAPHRASAPSGAKLFIVD